MLRRMNEHIFRDRIQNEHIKKNLRVADIDKKIKVNCLRWFGHVRKWGISELLRKIEINIKARDLKRGRKRPKMT